MGFRKKERCLRNDAGKRSLMYLKGFLEIPEVNNLRNVSNGRSYFDFWKKKFFSSDDDNDVDD